MVRGGSSLLHLDVLVGVFAVVVGLQAGFGKGFLGGIVYFDAAGATAGGKDGAGIDLLKVLFL